MKTRELIELLQAADPNGECDVRLRVNWFTTMTGTPRSTYADDTETVTRMTDVIWVNGKRSQ